MPSSADVRLLLFSAADAMRAWPSLAPHMAGIEAGSGGRYSVETAREAVQRGSWFAWGIARGNEIVGAALTEISEYPTGLRELFVVWLGGVGMRGWLHLTAEMEQTARELGCAVFAWAGRPGWKRVHAARGYRQTDMMMEKSL